MKKIATHNSCTGERGYWWRTIVTPFAKCQSKTLVEQYDAGVRYFDIRVRATERGYVAAHGIWESAEPLRVLLSRLDAHTTEDYYVALCYEGEAPIVGGKIADEVLHGLAHCKLAYFAEKKPQWRVLEEAEKVPVECCYKVLDGRSWHTLLPIPWLWKKVYYDQVEYIESHYKMVDFV